MAPKTDWRAPVSFMQRLSTVMKMTTAYQKSQSKLSAEEARRAATTSETKHFEEAQSYDEYEQKCEESITNWNNSALPPVAEDEVEESGSAFSPTSLDIGKYRHATYYREGLFSVIYKAPAPDHVKSDTPDGSKKNELVALKLTTPSMMEPPHDSRREARIMELSKSSNVMPLLETFREAGTRLVLVFPFMPYDMDQALQEDLLSKDQIRKCLKDLFTALQFIHSHGVIHRDVKPSNILLKSLDGPAYLSDFGIAWAPDAPGSEAADSKITDVGTTCYRPPELLFGNKKYGCSLDLWAAGCTVAEAVVPGHLTLFEAGDLGSELALIRSIFTKLGTPNLTVWPEAVNLPDWGKVQFYQYSPKPWAELLPKASSVECDLVSELVKYESGARMTASQVLQHAYFKQ